MVCSNTGSYWLNATVAATSTPGQARGRLYAQGLTLYSVPPLEEEPTIPLLARMYGFSLHAGTVCEAHQRSRLERLCPLHHPSANRHQAIVC